MRRVTRKLLATGVVVGLIVGVSNGARADVLAADADQLIVDSQSVVTRSTTPGGSVPINVDLRIQCTSRNSHMASIVNVSMAAIGSGGSNVPSGGTMTASSVAIVRPDDWPADGANCASESQFTSPQTSSVTVGAPNSVGTYTYTLKWTDGDADVVESAGTVTITLNVRPRPPVSPSATAGDGQITVSWGASQDASQIDGYKVLQDADVKATTTSLFSTITGLTNGQRYCFTVIAYKAGLESDPTSEVCATPTAPTVTPTNTAPSVTVTGVTATSYDKGSVPAAGCDVVDVEDGNSSFAATLSAVTGTYASDGIGSQTASCSYTDGGGITRGAQVTYSIVDPSPPLISYVINPEDPSGDNDWYTGDVTLTWSVTEPQSPNSLQKTGCVDQNITADQVKTAYACSATSAGGSAGPSSVTIGRDVTAPAVDITSPVDDFFTNSSAVTVTGTASDATSLLASTTVNGTSVTVTNGGFSTSVPLICGENTITAAASDNAGNQNADSIDVYRNCWTLTFNQPIDGSGVINKGKYGRVIPVKVNLYYDGTLVNDGTGGPLSMGKAATSCAATASDTVEEYSPGASTQGTDFRWDGTQWIYNMDTSKLGGTAGSCFKISVIKTFGTTPKAIGSFIIELTK